MSGQLPASPPHRDLAAADALAPNHHLPHLRMKSIMKVCVNAAMTTMRCDLAAAGALAPNHRLPHLFKEKLNSHNLTIKVNFRRWHYSASHTDFRLKAGLKSPLLHDPQCQHNISNKLTNLILRQKYRINKLAFDVVPTLLYVSQS
jgi:hypothetical protein